MPGVTRVFIVDGDEETRPSLLKLFRFATSKREATRPPRTRSIQSTFGHRAACFLTRISTASTSSNDRRRKTPLPVVFMTRDATIPMAVDAMKRGACDFLLKSLDDFAVLAAVRSV